MNNFSLFAYSNTRNQRRREKMKTLQKVCLVFTIIGAINWGLIGLFDFNLVSTLFGDENVVTRIVYVLVGIAGVINIGLLFEDWDN